MSAARAAWLFDPAPWTPAGPMPRGTLDVARIIRAFCNGAWGFCAAFIDTIGSRLGRSVRWIHERLSWLRKCGYLASKQQGRGRPAKYFVTSGFAELFAEQSRPILITECSENYKEYTKQVSLPLEASMGGNSAEPSQAGPHQPDRKVESTPNKGFDAYWQTFEDAGKELNETDKMLACREWCLNLSPEDQVAAFDHGRKICIERLAHLIPKPYWHLRGRQWNAVAKPRKLEYLPPEREEELTWLQRVARGLEKLA